MKFSEFYNAALARKGGEQALQSLLPPVVEKSRLVEVGDDRYLSEITRCIFKAGFVWRVIENKWPDFEAAFEGFVPAYWQQVPPEVLERLAADVRIVRNMQKIRTVPENARMIMDAAKDHGSFGQFLADWPGDDQVGLLLYLKRNGERLGGNSAQYFLRRVGWDGFILSHDVVTALTRAGILDASPASKKGLTQAQQAFNQWHQETGLPVSHLSRIVSFTVDN
ncbi:MAG: DNA-3-methyladenine glycosylase I [Marinobacter sp.]|uniref:DNA-3-methyladenine glycosylase I n=1 Tax=Marinobacter sp. TaxID=50741 RepID=UPI0029C12049|nr:DNA-3-methyladenine glycosylase I [Marinobacter sp.]MDX5440445.1 DNA-3-methyladenine glycosylase I [Alteromonadaceae bacterium]MDX5327256.1 DNA-3-methyladenine glycosylase I [Marinobacter sp.]MDX5334866.1 DNA-3-methyladenine glycosylase I [Marinobacter sp.]MDX5385528.1 DNA-3-methyladenine glycosylase I [Marinobacter sp.]MDX5471155.1 DNA-3-methyladenine glycosylase I [Marinobacter sp.]